MALYPRTASDVHALAYVLKGIKKRIEELTIVGNENSFQLYEATSLMPGSVSETISKTILIIEIRR